MTQSLDKMLRDALGSVTLPAVTWERDRGRAPARSGVAKWERAAEASKRRVEIYGAGRAKAGPRESANKWTKAHRALGQ